MDAITKALEEVENQIPPQVLRYAFIGNDHAYNRIPVNLQSLIREKVIGARVIKDCNIKGGVRDYVKLTGLPFRQTETGYRIYNIPKVLTQGRTIISPLAVGNSSYIRSLHSGATATAGSLAALGQRVVDGNLTVMPFYTTDVRTVGENLVLIEDVWQELGADAFLYAVFSNDELLSNIPPKSWNVFEDLVVLATKAWIYVNTLVDMDVGAIEMGAEIGRIREIIDGYSDANEMYREMVNTKWQKVALMADTTSRKRLIRQKTPLK